MPVPSTSAFNSEIKSPEISDESDTSDGSFEDVPDEIPYNTTSTENEKIILDKPPIKIEINPDEKPSKEFDLFKDVFDSKVYESDQKDTKKLESKNSIMEIEINPGTKTAQDFDMFEDVFNPQVSQESQPTSNFNVKSKDFSAIHSSDDSVTENMAEKMKQSNHLYLKIASKYLVNRVRMVVEFLVVINTSINVSYAIFIMANKIMVAPLFIDFLTYFL